MNQCQFPYKCINYLHIAVRHYVNSNIKSAVLKPATSSYKTSRIVDKVRVYVRGGSGGQGCPSAGGIGGSGGHVFVQCVKGASLRPYIERNNRRIIAEHGEHYKKGKLKMKAGRNAFIVVPPGTEIRSSNNILISDLNTDGDIIKIANGGDGGSSKTQDFNGVKGERKNIILELKTIADVALTGFPNAGKSSLLRMLSRARPKVGEYPFTTISPMVGSVFYTDGRQISVADLPGLIEDAHRNKGMGHRFLRHIERTNVILLVVDINGFQLNSSHPYRSPLETVILLLQELLLYQDVLLERPICLVINKMDTTHARNGKDNFMNELKNIGKDHKLLADHVYADEILMVLKKLTNDHSRSIFPISAVTGDGLETLKESLYHIVPSLGVLKDENLDNS